MAEVLPERLGVGDADLGPSVGPPSGLGVEVLVDPVLLQEPVALAGVAGEHPPLEVGDPRDVDEEPGGLGPAVAVEPFDRVDVIEVRDLRQGRGRLPLAGLVVGQGGGEAGVADQPARRLVVAEVVDRRRGQDEVGPGPPEGLDDPPTRLVVLEDRQVAELQADVIGPDQVGRRLRLGPPDGGDRLGVAVDAPAVAGRHRGQGDVATRLGEQGQGPGALELDVVGVGVDGQDSGGVGQSGRASRTPASRGSSTEGNRGDARARKTLSGRRPGEASSEFSRKCSRVR